VFRTFRLLSYLPVLDELTLDWRVVAFCAGASALTVLFFALVPALVAARADVRVGGLGTRATRRAGWLRAALAGAQVALSFALVVAAALLAQSVHRLQSVDFGFDPDAVLQFSFRPNRAGYDDEATRIAMDRLQERLSATPGLSNVALALFSPLGAISGSSVRAAEADEAAAIRIGSRDVTSSYFDVLRIPVLEGRTFTRAEAASSRVPDAPIVLSQRLAERLFGPAPAVGQTILQQGRVARGVVWQPRTVIGVVGNTVGDDVREGHLLLAYEPFGRNARVASVLVRPDLPFARAVGLIRDAAREAAPGVAIDDITPLRAEADEAIAQERLLSRLSLVIGAIAGLLGLAGLYAATSQVVGERTREYAIRAAIGATKVDLAGAILGRVGRVTAGGLAAGAVIVWPLTGLLATYLFGVSRGDGITLAATALALLATALLASWPAVRRARSVDPASALRTD
jgi:putative ABC transport system permease protein